MKVRQTPAGEFPTGAMLGNRPDWLGRNRYTIQVKLPQGVDARTVSQDSALFDEMLRKLLTDRFQMKYHWGEQTVPDAYVLLAGTPKMKKADPNSRSFCKFGPPEGEKDVRTADSAFNGEFHCQNVTMDQFADLAQAVANSEIKVSGAENKNRTGGVLRLYAVLHGRSQDQSGCRCCCCGRRQTGRRRDRRSRHRPRHRGCVPQGTRPET